MGVADPGTAVDRDLLMAVDQLGNRIQVAIRRDGYRRPEGEAVRRKRRQASVLLGDVARELNDGDALAGNGMLERHLEDPGRLCVRGAARVVDAAPVKHAMRVGLLKVGTTELDARCDRRQREHRCARPVRVIEPIEKVYVPGPRGSGAHRYPAGELRLRPGRERTNLLVANVNPTQLAVAPDRIADRIEAIPDHAVDPLHTSPDSGLN